MCNNQPHFKTMAKKNSEFMAVTTNGTDLELETLGIFYSITEEMAKGIRTGIMIGLMQKYKDPSVTYREF